MVRMKGLTSGRHNGWRHSVCWQVVLLMGRPAEPSYRGLAAGRKLLILGSALEKEWRAVQPWPSCLLVEQPSHDCRLLV